MPERFLPRYPDMNEKKTVPSQPTEALLANARAVFEDLSAVLRQSIGTIEQNSESLSDAHVRQQIAQFHTNTLLQLIEIEVDLEGRNDDADTGGRSELDLDAARTEILERLSRSAE